MNKETILELLKARIGITSTVRDAYLQAIVDGVLAEMEFQHAIDVTQENAYMLMFIVDYCDWRYRNRDTGMSGKGTGEMPMDLHWRLRNLILQYGSTAQKEGETDDVQP